MRTTPYPSPPHRPWQAVATLVYVALAIAGIVCVAYLFAVPAETASGRMALFIWGVFTLPSAVACAYGVIRERYRWEWIAAWPLGAGTAAYTVLAWARMNSIWDAAGNAALTALSCSLVARAIQLGLIDAAARATVLERRVQGEAHE